MKIISLSPYAYFKELKETHKNKSGLAYIIGEIIEKLSIKVNKIDIITQSIFISKKRIKNFEFIPKRFIDLLLSFNFYYFIYALKIIFFEKNKKFSFNLRILLYFIVGGYTKKILKKNKYDCAHIHSLSWYTFPFIKACIETNTKFFVTLHGINFDDSNSNISKHEKNLEKELIKLLDRNRVPITVVSQGIKKKLRSLNVSSPILTRNFIIPKNFKDIEKVSPDIIKKFNFNKKNVIIVGSINKNKNQRFAVKAFLDKRLQNINLFLVGDGEDLKDIKIFIEKNNMKNCKLLGRLDKIDVMRIYKYMDLLILPSLKEGFGLSIIEAYSEGVPALFFNDIYSFKDLYNENCSIIPKNRSNSSFVDSIILALERKWNKKEIIKFSKSFYPQESIKNYINAINLTKKSNNLSKSELNAILFKIRKKQETL